MKTNTSQKDSLSPVLKVFERIAHRRFPLKKTYDMRHGFKKISAFLRQVTIPNLTPQKSLKKIKIK